ncbi:MAG: serine hydrolase [Ruminiclostridium sp.]|nr:serine hydrolase [Ruminiclostridium sp.]
MLLTYGSPQETGMSVERMQYVEGLVEGWVKKGITPAASFLVARKGIIVSHKAFGKSGPEEDADDLKIDSIFPLCSLTKPITATCIMMLVEDGLIDIKHSVSKYIPEFSGERKKEVKIHHLLTHTSGLRDEDTKAAYEKNKNIVPVPPCEETQDPGINEYLFLSYDTPLDKIPGTKMEYCSYGYQLLGEIVRRVSGQSIQDFAKQRIFNPLGMKDTNYIVPDSLYNRVVRRSDDFPGGKWFTTLESFKNPSASGGVYSTVMDMAIFGQTFLNKGVYGNARILSPLAVSLMTKDQIVGISAQYGEEVFINASWGYGWNISGSKMDDTGSILSEKAFDHGGFGGIRLFADPEYDVVWVYFCVEGKEYTRSLFNNAVMSAVNL